MLKMPIFCRFLSEKWHFLGAFEAEKRHFQGILDPKTAYFE
jgi:hypothetical protein